MAVIIKNLSRITAGSPMVGTPIILVWRPINPGLIKDLWIVQLRPKTSDMAKEQERKVEPGPLAYRAIALPLSYSSHQQPPLIDQDQGNVTYTFARGILVYVHNAIASA